MSNFQLVTIIFFVIITVIALLMFGGIIPTPGGSDDEEINADLEIWGTLDIGLIRDVLKEFEKELGENLSIAYVEKRVENIELDLLRAIGSGKSPDLLLFPEKLLLTIEDTLFPIPFESFSVRQLKDQYIEGTEVYIRNDGILAVPLIVDPVVMYWNRDIFAAHNILSPPVLWDDLVTLGEVITKRDNQGTIFTSAIALGESRNITHMKDILSTMFMQLGNDITKRLESGIVRSTLRDQTAAKGVISPAESALLFYTDFSNPRLRFYSWNSSLPNSQEAFGGDDLAIYFGRASDLRDLQRLNPHLNFDVSVIPQIQDGIKATYGSFTSISVLNSSQNISAAFSVAFRFSTDKWQKKLSDAVFLAPTSRKLLREKQSDPHLDIFYKSAVIAKTWLDPDDRSTISIFEDMVDAVNSGSRTSIQAVESGDLQLVRLLEK